LAKIKDYPERGCFGETIDKRGVHEKETDKPICYYQKKELKIVYSFGQVQNLLRINMRT